MKRSHALRLALAIALLVPAAYGTPVRPAIAAGSSATVPAVGVHVSEYTKALHYTVGQPAPSTDAHGWYYGQWAYFQVYTMLQEMLHADGTPSVEVSDAAIEAGSLVVDGRPKYPIVISLMNEAVSDSEIIRLREYVSAGGVLYVGGSSFTRTETGNWRQDADGQTQPALSAEMGLMSVPVAAKPGGGTWSWSAKNTIRRVSDDPMVQHLTADTNLFWPLPARFDSDAYYDLVDSTDGMHSLWVTQLSAENPAQPLAVVPAAASYVNVPLLAKKDYGSGRFVYHSEMAPLAGWGGLVADTSEYLFFRTAIEEAFVRSGVPVVRTAAWRYPYRAAVQTRWDVDFYPGDVRNLAAIEKARGVHGQYYFVTSLAEVDDGNWVKYIAQQSGAICGSHSDLHIGMDPLSPADAAEDLRLSLDKLQSWLGTRPIDWVSPGYRAVQDKSFEIADAQGIEGCGEQNFGPFPHYTLSMTEAGRHYSSLQLPTSEWLNASATSSDYRARMEMMPDWAMPEIVDFYYRLGGLINVYGHPYSANRARLQSYLDAALAKPDVMRTNSHEVAAWWRYRDPVRLTPDFSINSGLSELTVGVTGNVDAETAVDVTPPGYSLGSLSDVEILLDGVRTTEYTAAAYGLKIKVGTAHSVTVRYRKQSDTTPPAAPTSVAAVDTGEGGAILVSWTKPADSDFDHVHIYRSTDPGTLGDLAYDDLRATSLRDAGLSNDRRYFYTLRAVDLAGNESVDSALVSAVPSGGDTYALDFDPADDAVVVASSPSLDIPGALTVEARVKVKSFAQKHGIIAGRTTGVDRSYELYYDSSGKVYFYVRKPDNSGYKQVSTAQRVLRINEWQHVAGVLDPTSGELRIYVDGQRQAVGSYTSGGARVSSNPVCINAEPSGTSFLYCGDALIDEVRLSRSARYAGNAFAVPTSRFAPDTSTVALWHLDEGSGSVVRDSSAGGNNGVFVGDPIWTKGYPFAGELPPDTTPPAPPASVSVSDLLIGGALRVAWSDPSDSDFSHSRLYRSTLQGSLGELVADSVRTGSYDDSGLENGTEYFYTVTSVDVSGNESKNTNQYSGIPSGSSGDLAARFDSTDDLAVVPYVPTLNAAGAMTVETWVRVETMPTKNTIIASRWDGSDQCWSLYYSGDGRVYFLVKDPSGVNAQVISPVGTITRGVWYHVAGVVDPATGQLRLYVNGVRRGYRAYAPAGIRQGAARLAVNGYFVNNAWAGLGDVAIDELRISDVVRYAGSGISVPSGPFEIDSNIVGLWRCDEGAGSTLIDAGPRGHNADIQGDLEWLPR